MHDKSNEEKNNFCVYETNLMLEVFRCSDFCCCAVK